MACETMSVVSVVFPRLRGCRHLCSAAAALSRLLMSAQAACLAFGLVRIVQMRTVSSLAPSWLFLSGRALLAWGARLRASV